MLNWGIIGCGGIADRRTMPGIVKAGGKIVAVMDVNRDVAEKIRCKYNADSAYTTAEELACDKDVDVIYIATPVFFHKEQAMLCLKNKKHVLIEKPMAMDADEAQNILNEFKKANVHIMIGYMMRYHNLHQTILEEISSGKIGDVVNVETQFSCWYPDIAGAWRQDKSKSGGGVIMDLGVHCFDLIQYLSGSYITDMKAFYDTISFNYTVEDSAAIICKFQNKALGHIAVNFNIPDKASSGRIAFYGTKGSLIAEGTLGQEEGGKLSIIHSPQGAYNAAQQIEESNTITLQGGGEDLYAKQIKDFTQQITTNNYNYDFAQDSVRIQRLCDTLYNK